MPRKKQDANLAAVEATLAAADRQRAAAGTADAPQPPLEARIPRAPDPSKANGDILSWCAALDQSDTDNAHRLIAHFGSEMRVMAQEKARANLFVVWAGDHWDTATGGHRSNTLAQQLGDRIKLEVPLIEMSENERALVERAKKATAKEEGERTAADQRAIKDADDIEKRIENRRESRAKFAVSSKNKARLGAMLDCAASHILTQPDEFNADPLRVAVKTHTLKFTTVEEMEVNPEAEREDAPADTPSHVLRKRARVIATKGHRREDLITEVVPVSYVEDADCPRWKAFMEEFLPRPEVRRLAQVSFGLGLLGVTVQKLFFHYGDGANGKSVAMETMVRVLGQAAVTLPSESFFGSAGQGGGATPDLARLHGRRFLRVQELPEGADLREDLVKKVTGGEVIPVRDLFQGYFDFMPIFTGHMSGNGYPRITGTDNGIWRRMAVIYWPVTIPEERQRNFEEVVREFEPEYPGILNWLIEGAEIYLTEGLKIPKAVTDETQKFRDEMDPTAAFNAACIRPDQGGPGVGARDLFNAYASYCLANGITPVKETRFGKVMAKRYQREDGRVRKYLNIRLHEVPTAPASEFPEGYGG